MSEHRAPDPPREQTELEAKWSVRTERGFAAFQARAVRLGVRLGRARHLLIRDYYLDTPEGFFGKRRISCRLRHSSGEWELTLKDRTKLDGGVAQRKERTYGLGAVPSLARARERLLALLAGIPGHERLAALFTIDNRRSVLHAALPDGTSAECSFDRVTLARGARKLAMLEIELEFLKGDRAAFLSFARSIGHGDQFSPSVRSKVATALAAFSLETKATGTADEVFDSL